MFAALHITQARCTCVVRNVSECTIDYIGYIRRSFDACKCSTATWHMQVHPQAGQLMDGLSVQASTNTLLSHFASLVLSLWLIRIVGRNPTASGSLTAAKA